MEAIIQSSVLNTPLTQTQRKSCDLYVFLMLTVIAVVVTLNLTYLLDPTNANIMCKQTRLNMVFYKK